MENCFICRKHRNEIKTVGEVIYENDFIYVGHIDNGKEASYLGHLMIDLKRHTPSLADMNELEAQAFGMAMAVVSKALKKALGAEHIYAAVSGNQVPHLHMHLIPRFPGTPKEFWGPFAVYDAPNAKMGREAEVTEVCRQIKQFIKGDCNGAI